MSRLIATLALCGSCSVPSEYVLADSGRREHVQVLDVVELHTEVLSAEVLDGGRPDLVELHTEVLAAEVLDVGRDHTCWVDDLVGSREVPVVPPDLWTVPVFCCWGRCSSYIVGNGSGCFPCGDHCRTGADLCSCSDCRF